MSLRMINGEHLALLNEEFRKVLCGPQKSRTIKRAPILGTNIILERNIYKGDLANTLKIDGRDIVNFRLRGKRVGFIQDGNVTGGIAKNENGEIFIIHKGILNLPPRTKTYTLEREYNWRRENVILTKTNGQELNKLYYVIGNLYADDFRDNFKSFVMFCKDLKPRRSDGEDLRNTHDDESEEASEQPDTELQRKVRELISRDTTVVPPRTASVMDWKESRVTAALAHQLEENNIHVEQIRFSDFECDLLSEDFGLIFEIKSHGRPGAYYSAIGQLTSYKTFLRNRGSKMVCVTPVAEENRFSQVLHGLGIHILSFTEEDGVFDFPDLSNLIGKL